MKFNHHNIFIFAAMYFIALPLRPQDNPAPRSSDGVGNQQVVVVKEYEATIQDAQKINIQPDIPEVPTTTPKLDYSIPQQEYKDIAFEPDALKPLAIGQEKPELFPTSFIKVGMGSQLMPLAQLAYNDNKTKNLKLGFFYDHLSAKGYTIHNQQFSDDMPGAYLRYFPKKFEVGAEFTFRNYRTHFYGADTTLSEQAARQVFRTYNGLVYFKNAQPNKALIDVKQTLDFNYFQETYGKAYEYYVTGQTNFSKTFLQYHTITFDLNFDISDLKNDSLAGLQRVMVTPLFGYAFNNDDWKAHGKIGLTEDGTRLVLATDIHAEKRLYQHALIAFVNYTRGNQKNSFQSFALQNNYIQNFVQISNSTVGDFSTGFKGTIGNFSYNAAFHLVQMNRMPLFINDSADMKRFIVIYDSAATIYNAHVEMGYNAKEWLRFLLIGDYNDYRLSNYAYAWNQPAFKGTLRVTYVWKNKISAYLDLYGLTNAYALIPDNQTVTLKGTADINLGFDYIMNKHISFFANLNNIANIKYSPYYLYPGFGINGMIGAKFSF